MEYTIEFHIRLILVFFMSVNMIQAASKPKENFLDLHYNATKRRRDKISYPNRRRTQLYSRNSGKHVQILSHRGKVVAKGLSGDRYAGLVILTDTFGKVQIKGVVTDRFICFDKRGHLISKRRATSRCTFIETYGKDAFTEYESAAIKGRFLAFNRNGNPRHRTTTRSGTKAVQFVERPKPRKMKKPRYYRGKSRGISEATLYRHKLLALEQARELGIKLPSGVLDHSAKDATGNSTKLRVEYEAKPLKPRRNKNRYYKGRSRGGISERTLNRHQKKLARKQRKMGINFATWSQEWSHFEQKNRRGKGRRKQDKWTSTQRNRKSKIQRKTPPRQTSSRKHNGQKSSNTSKETFRIDQG